MIPWPLETKTYALALRSQGERVQDIASAIGKSKKAVEAYFMRLARMGGIPPKPSRKGHGAFWVPERIARVKDMLAKGHYRKDIAAEFGVTTSAISGVVDRMRQAGTQVQCRPPSIHSGSRANPAYAVKSKLGAIIPPRNPIGLARPISKRCKGKLIIDLTDHECKWGIGYDKQRRHLFCGAAAIADKPWCSQHLEQAVQRKA